MANLTLKQQKFVDAYNGNATEAALVAGYSEKTARAIGAENLTKPDIVSAIHARQDEPRTQRIATREERQAFWTRVMYGNENDIGYEDGEKVEVEVKMSDRLKAAELLGRSEADFTERIQADMKVNVIRKEYKKST